MVNVCAAAPAVAEEGVRLVMLGTGFDGGGDELSPPPPPQEDIRRQKSAAIASTAKMAWF
jgi:hypothetical protein